MKKIRETRRIKKVNNDFTFVKLNKLSLISVCALAIAIPVISSATEIVPSGNSDFYYRIGGGQSVPVPGFMSDNTIHLGADGSLNLNYNCGLFNPMMSITNSLNNIKNSFQNIQQNVVNNATAAIAEFPMYLIARSNGPLYNLLNNGLFGAKKDFEFSTKSCQVMQNDIAQGENPYHNWTKIAVGNDWKHYMSLASSSSMNDTNGDINVVRNHVQKDNGKNGVPWVHGKNTGRGGIFAGGDGQPAIHVIYDTSIAGYNVSLQSNRDYDDTRAPSRTEQNAHLVDIWRSPIEAAEWITTVVGDETITTFPGGEKGSNPGVGLLPDNEKITQDIQDKLVRLISGSDSLSIKNLKGVSAPHVMINESVIDTIRRQNPVNRSILVGKISQEAATARLIDKVQLALQILEEGRDVPAIYNNEAAQQEIQKAVDKLKRERDDFLFDIRANHELVSNTVTELMQSTYAQQVGNASIQTGNKPGKEMELGAIKKDQ